VGAKFLVSYRFSGLKEVAHVATLGISKGDSQKNAISRAKARLKCKNAWVA
jgi:hypothetical protein